MGCDIHMHVEYVKRGEDPAKQWRCGDLFTINKIPISFCDDRNYGLFAVLANVRNYDYVEYIDDPRGIPENASDYVKEAFDRWKFDAHSASYFTLKELIDYDEENEPRYDSIWSDARILEDLINNLKRRANELDVIWDFMWDSKTDEGYKLSDRIRIVFWFDN